MVKLDKLITYSKNASKAKNLAKLINKKNKNDKSRQIGIKTYKQNIFKNSKSKSKTKSKTKSKIKSKTKSRLESRSNIKSRTKHKANNMHQVHNMHKSSNIKIPKMSKIENIISSNSSNINNDYIIAIPSYKRSDIIQSHTLAILNKHNIKSSHITIFVANQEESDIYKKAIPQSLYNNIVVGVLGLKNQRNFISDYYPEDTHIVEMDDDIKKIMQLVIKKESGSTKGISRNSKKTKTKTKTNTNKTVKPIDDLDAFIRRAFEICIKSNIFLWGVYPLINPHFMTYKVTTDLRFIVGPMWGMINRHRLDLKLTVDEKENSERTLQFWVADGAVLRFNNVGIETKYYTNQGGMQAEGKNRKIEALKSVYHLHKLYPTLTKVSLTKKSGMPEIKMNRSRI